MMEGKIYMCGNIKGGSGATLISLNMAYRLSVKYKTLFIQISKYPDLQTYWNIQEKTTFETLLHFLEIEKEIEEGIKNSIQKTETLHVLPSPNGKEAWQTINAKNVKSMLDVLKKHFEYIVIDMDSSCPDEIQNELVNGCDQQFILCNYDPASFQKITCYTKYFVKDVMKKTHIIINQAPSVQNSQYKLHEKIISKVLAALPYSPKETIEAMVYKKPIEISKRKPLGLKIMTLIENIIQLKN